MTSGHRLLIARTIIGIDQEQLAKLLGLSKSYICKMENDERDLTKEAKLFSDSTISFFAEIENLPFSQSPEKEGKCPACRKIKILIYGPDPFNEEIHGDITPVWKCEDCRHESAMDI